MNINNCIFVILREYICSFYFFVSCFVFYLKFYLFLFLNCLSLLSFVLSLCLRPIFNILLFILLFSSFLLSFSSFLLPFMKYSTGILLLWFLHILINIFSYFRHSSHHWLLFIIISRDNTHFPSFTWLFSTSSFLCISPPSCHSLYWTWCRYFIFVDYSFKYNATTVCTIITCLFCFV